MDPTQFKKLLPLIPKVGKKYDYRTALQMYGVANGFRPSFGFERINSLLRNKKFRTKLLDFFTTNDIPLCALRDEVIYNCKKYKPDYFQLKEGTDPGYHWGKILGYPEPIANKDISKLTNIHEYQYYLLDKEGNEITWIFGYSFTRPTKKTSPDTVTKKLKQVFNNLDFIGGVLVKYNHSANFGLDPKHHNQVKYKILEQEETTIIW